ncbi:MULTISPECIES: transcriptional regulator [unclassified Streptomyces]|uniref:transcriptional regulator n=1 Tax=unclassified Streptomyces TaxID=2593676 RepID=UPI000BAC7322|nr:MULTISPECIES: transcriptional regulator [unclassified Streptomyces]ASY37082.1 transcriptional regulator [Streptomyces sp. CLI2509]MYX24163.1 transcriptional regulator [Streptomyces sp. SID8380]
MPERNIEFGQFGARGVKGHQLVARRLDSLAGFIASPVTTRRGLTARLRYLTSSPRQLAAAREAGLTISDRTIRAQKAGARTPSARTLREIEAAYEQVRRQNVARHLQARLERGGRGTRVEFHPVNQSGVVRPRQRAVEYRTLNVRKWGRIVGAWESGDDAGLDDAWVNEVVVDLGSQWGQYEYVTNIGFAA